VPNLKAYDPAYAYEIAEIVRDGLERMYLKGEHVFYYLTVGNETYSQLPMPDGVAEGIRRGMYLLRPSPLPEAKLHVDLFGSGSILNEVLAAQALLADRYGVGADVFSVTSYKELYRDASAREREAMRNPLVEPQPSWLATCLAGHNGPFVAASDYLKALPDSIGRWLPGRLLSLGTDGFGRSATRSELRDFFEVDARHVAFAALSALYAEGHLSGAQVEKARQELGIDPAKANPLVS
jgi:pyruvate dehydrogenase E1 component